MQVMDLAADVEAAKAVVGFNSLFEMPTFVVAAGLVGGLVLFQFSI